MVDEETGILERSLEREIVTQSTYDWLKPLYEKEVADLEEIRAAAAERKNNPFHQQDDSDDDSDDALLTTSTTTIQNIEGTSTKVTFVTDTNSTGHGNKVWHASIATCRYLKEVFYEAILHRNRDRRGWHDQTFLSEDPLRCLELGAGTAVPSLFLAQLLKGNKDDKKIRGMPKLPPLSILRITDAKYYRNIMQILRSVDLWKEATSDNITASNVVVEVHPHNWGEPWPKLVEDDDPDSNANRHDLVIVSDCIYNPEGHEALLESMANTIALPDIFPTKRPGVAVLSFSLHGNVEDDAIWEFIDKKLPSTTRTDANEVTWMLTAKCVSTSNGFRHELGRIEEHLPAKREGWNMEETMVNLGMITEGMVPERWLAYVYEVGWVMKDYK